MLGWYESVLALVMVLLFSQSSSCAETVCEPLMLSICQGQGYNMTIVPNRFGHRSQRKALNELQPLIPLIRFSCSRDIALFLCSLYFPMCTILETAIPPCRSLCLNAKSGCESVVKAFGYTWPQKLDCQGFPELGAGQTCVFRNRSLTTQVPTRKISVKNITSLNVRERQKICWEADLGMNKRCCRQGNKAAKLRLRECSLGKSTKQKLSRMKKKFIKKATKICLADMSKHCYQSCCQYKKRQLKKLNRNGKSQKTKTRRP